MPVLGVLDAAPIVLVGVGPLIGAAHTHLSELRVESDGLGHGSLFRLVLPIGGRGAGEELRLASLTQLAA